MTNKGKMEFPDWQNHLQDLAFEYDREKLSAQVQKVETLIFERFQQLPPNDSRGEREFLIDAIETLRTIKRDRLGFPDW
jgi:hypothetical protein